MNKEQLIKILEKSFTKEWLRLTQRFDDKMIGLIEDSFLIDKMLDSINLIIKKSNGRYSIRRHQEYQLTILAQQFAMILFVVSNEGDEVNKKSIQVAQKILKVNGKCKIYPCTKLFD